MAYKTPIQKMDLFCGGAKMAHAQKKNHCCNFFSSTPDDLEAQAQASRHFARRSRPISLDLSKEEGQEDSMMVSVMYKHCHSTGHLHNHFKDMSLVDNSIEMQDSAVLNSTAMVTDTMEVESLYESAEEYALDVDSSNEAVKQPGRLSFRRKAVDSRDSGIASHDSGEGLQDSIMLSSSYKGDFLNKTFKARCKAVVVREERKCSSPRSLCLCGEEKIDVLTLLAKHGIADYVLKMLEPCDLLAVTRVCKVWRRICRQHRDSYRRLRCHLEGRRKNKENLSPSSPEGKEETVPRPESPLTSAASSLLTRVTLRQIHNIGNRIVRHAAPKSPSPPASPTKRRFFQFVKAGAQLAKGKTLLPCPRCSLPSQVDSETNSGLCTREGCKYHYCTRCKCQFHGNQQCSISLISSQCARKRPATIGSAKSKKNLRRL